MADRSAQDLTGQRLGHFRVDGVIGRGGMSVLYRATDTRLGRRVALKVIDEALAADREFRERFVDEARNTSAIDHSHVVPLYDFDETDGHLYIAMRHVEGPDLASVINGRPLSVARTLRLLDQVADALDAVHARGLVHLDVKPANVLVTTRESAGEHVYLADFGLTRRGATGHRTSGGDFLGSPTYAAPEHLRGEPVDARTDVYSLTCVLFTCLTGRAPYLGTVTEVIDGHLSGDVPSVAELSGLDPRIDDVVRRGMDPDRPRRHETASAVIEAARGALTVPGPAPLVGPPPANRRPGPPARPPGPRPPSGPPVLGPPTPPPRRPVPPVAPVRPGAPVPPPAPVSSVPPATSGPPRSDSPATGAAADDSPATAAPADTGTETATDTAADPAANPAADRVADPAPDMAADGASSRAASAGTEAGEGAGSTAAETATAGSTPAASTPPSPVPAAAGAGGPTAEAGAPRAPGEPVRPRGGPPRTGPVPSGPFSAPTGGTPSGPFPSSTGRTPSFSSAGRPPGRPGPLTRSSVAPPRRLRDPLPPDRDGSFARAPASVPGWPVVVGAGVLLVVLVVLLVLLLT